MAPHPPVYFLRDQLSVRLKHAPGLAWHSTGLETVVIDLARGLSLGLNPTAGYVWARLGDADEAAIAADLACDHGIDPNRARRDVAAILARLRERGLLEEA